MLKFKLEVLESRLTPSTYNWEGDANGNWNTLANWSVNGNVPLMLPNSADEVVFNSESLACLIPEGVTGLTGKLTSTSEFEYDITIAGRLTVDNGSAVSYWQGGDIDFASGSDPEPALEIINGAQWHWQTGSLGASGIGVIYIGADSFLYVEEDADSLGADVFIGRDANGTIFANIHGNMIFQNLNDNVVIENGNIITVGAVIPGLIGIPATMGGGTLAFLTVSVGEGEKGGLLAYTGEPTILNYGDLGFSNDGDGYLYIDPVIINYNNLGITSGTNVTFNGSAFNSGYDITNYSTFLMEGATLNLGSGYYQTNDAMLNIVAETVNIQGDVYLNNGELQFTSASIGTVDATLNITGTLTVDNGTIITMRLRHSTIWTCDNINVSGNIDLTGGDTMFYLNTPEEPSNEFLWGMIRTEDQNCLSGTFSDYFLNGWQYSYGPNNDCLRIHQ